MLYLLIREFSAMTFKVIINLFCSVTKSYLTFYHPMDCSVLGSSVLHYISEFAQIHVHWVSDVI